MNPNSPIRYQSLFEGIDWLRLEGRASEAPSTLILEREHVHLFFNLDGDASFQFGPMYMRPLPAGQSFRWTWFRFMWRFRSDCST